MNFGWPTFEGPRRTGLACFGDDTLNFQPPIYAYDRSGLGGAAVISGGRYRRPSSGPDRFPPNYDGDIFVGDVGLGFLRRLKFDGSNWAIAPQVPGQPTGSDWAQNMEG